MDKRDVARDEKNRSMQQICYLLHDFYYNNEVATFLTWGNKNIPTLEKSIPSLGKYYSQPGNKKTA